MSKGFIKRKGFFNRVILVYLSVLVLAVFFAELYVTRVIRDSSLESLRERLRVQASLIRESMDMEFRDLDRVCARLKEIARARVTVVALDGTVMGDSDLPSLSMENHRTRPEIQQALLEGVGHSIRRSASKGEDMLYTAVPVLGPEGLPRGTVRLSIPLTELNSSVNKARAKVLLGVVGVLLAAGAVALIQTRRVQDLVRDVSEFSSAVAGGRFDARLNLRGLGEFEDIAANLNLMASDLRSTIRRDRERYERLDAVLASVPDVLIILDASDSVVMVNKAARDFFGAADPTGRPVKEVLRDRAFLDVLDAAKSSSATRQSEVRIESRGPRLYLAKVSPVEHASRERVGFVVLFHDITEARRVEQVRRDFVANVSHELKTPIASIKGFADTLAEGALEDGENAPRFIRIIQSNADRLARLVADLMTITQVEFGTMEIRKEPLDPGEMLRQVAANFALAAGEKRIEIRLEADPAAGEIMADRDRLIQILGNLVDNSLKYTERGRVTLGARREAGETAVLYVSDTGIGIPPRHIPRLGERFYRVDLSRSRQLGGTGLGLAIVKHLVQAHGWSMEVQSSEGEGTTVRIVTGPPPAGKSWFIRE